MSLEYPYLLLLFPLVLLCLNVCKERNEAILFPHLRLLREIKKNRFDYRYIIYIILLLSIIALASPVEKKEVEKSRDAYAIALLLDVSDSMRERMGRYQKFETAKNVCLDFIQKRKDDFLGLSVFGAYAYIASPLTYDKALLSEIVDGLYIGIAGGKTDLYDALFLTAQHFAKQKARAKIAILLTDGQDTASKITPDAALRSVQKHGLKVYTIGLGDDGTYDERALAHIANATGGTFFRAQNKSMLEDVYARIDALEKSEMAQKQYYNVYFYEYPLFLAVMLLLLYIFLRNKRGL